MIAAIILSLLAVGDTEVYSISRSYHGHAVEVYVVSDGTVVCAYNGSVIGPLPLSALDKLDGGTEEATVGSSSCWTNPYTHQGQLVSIKVTADTLSGAVAKFHAAANMAIAKLKSMGFVLGKCV